MMYVIGLGFITAWLGMSYVDILIDRIFGEM